jgi:hypothetical protein
MRSPTRALAVLLPALVAGAGCTQFSDVERRGADNRAPVTGTIALEVTTVQKTVAFAFNENKPALPERWRKFYAARPGDDAFPRPDQVPATRSSLFIFSTGDADDTTSYWPSEYYIDGNQTRFRCNFMLKLDSAGTAGTSVEVIEASPRVWVGKMFSFGPHGPGRYLDIRDVEPTTSDRVALLDLVRRLVGR